MTFSNYIYLYMYICIYYMPFRPVSICPRDKIDICEVVYIYVCTSCMNEGIKKYTKSKIDALKEALTIRKTTTKQKYDQFVSYNCFV